MPFIGKTEQKIFLQRYSISETAYKLFQQKYFCKINKTSRVESPRHLTVEVSILKVKIPTLFSP